MLAYLGVAGGAVRLLQEFIATGLFDAVLSHNRFTLVDRSAGPLLDDAGQRGVAFVNGAPYGGGMLSKGPDIQPRYAYRLASPAIQDAVRAMQRACADHGVSLADMRLRQPSRRVRRPGSGMARSAAGSRAHYDDAVRPGRRSSQAAPSALTRPKGARW